MGAIAACPFGSEIARILRKMFGFSTFPSSFGLHWSPFWDKISSQHSQSVVLIGQKTKAFQLPSVNKGAVPVALLLLPDFDYTLGRTIAGAGQLNVRSESAVCGFQLCVQGSGCILPPLGEFICPQLQCETSLETENWEVDVLPQ